MKYKTILTSKGTTTIPTEVRKKLGLKPGMKVEFEEDSATGHFWLKRDLNIEEVRAMNRAYLRAHKIRPLSDEAIKEVAAQAWSDKISET